MHNRINKIKKIHSILSCVFFISLLIYCIIIAKNYDIFKISLSFYGVDDRTSTIWNCGLFISGIFLLIDARRQVSKFYSKSKLRKILKLN